MKASLLKSLILVGLTGFGAIGAQAQPAPKIAVVDLEKLFTNYWQTSIESNKINAERAQAQTSADAIIKDRADLITKAQTLFNETNNNPAITPDAKAKAEAQLKAWSADINAKAGDLQTFSQNTSQVLQNEFNTYKNLAISTITEAATKLAKSKGANLLIDKSNSTTYQTSAFLYIAPDYSDLTDEVLKELNRDHPVTPLTPPATGAAAPKTGSGSKPPSVTFPAPSTK